MSTREIIDVHQHVGSQALGLPRGLTPMGKERPAQQDIELRREVNREAGISWAVLQPTQAYYKPRGLSDTAEVNDRMAAYRDLSPDEFPVVLGTTEPMYGRGGLDEVNRCADELGLRGMAWHHRFNGCFIDSEPMWPLIERLGETSMVPVIHCQPESSVEAPWRLQRLARDFPDITFIALVGFWGYERSRQILDLADSTQNILWDIGGPVNYLSIEEWVSRNGSQNLCFSADVSYLAGDGGVPRLIGQLDRADITDDDRANILSHNVRRAFGLSIPAEGPNS